MSRRRPPRLRSLGVIAAITLGACGGSSGGALPTAKLDGSPRIPDVEGIATHVTLNSITIASKTYRVTRALQSFSTYDGSPARLLDRQGQFVEAGIKGNTVGWLAAIGVVDSNGVANYVGNLVGLKNGRLVFKDGTTLAVTTGITASVHGTVRAEINAAKGKVIGLVPA